MVIIALLITVFSACGKTSKEQFDAAIKNLSFRDIPGVTQNEISAIEALQKKYGFFTCGVNLNTDSFYDKNGELSGFGILFYEWLSGVFGIPFKPVLYEWGGSQRRIESGEIDFTIELSDTPERRAAFFMTSPLAQRPLKVYQIEGAQPIGALINSRRLPRIGIVRGTASDAVKGAAEHEFETVFVDSHAHAYSLLKSGEINAYIAPDTTEAALDVYGGAASWDFFPLIFISSCLLTGNAELEPVISVLEKALDDHTLAYLAELRKAGYEKYLAYKLHTLLTEEERSFIKNNPRVPIAAEFNNYPISFFDNHTNEWQGIYFDALEKIADITGLEFKCVNRNDTRLPELVAMLEKGEALILSELFRLKEYEGRFLWSDVPLINDNYAFITSNDFHNIGIDDIPYLHVGIRKYTPYSELFKIMFADHKNLTEYNTQDETWDSLKRGDVDVIFTTRRRLSVYTNYYEDAGFKLNLIFNDYSFDSSVGYNKDAALLKSINSKALKLIKINNISTQWMNKTYDYRVKLAAAQRPWLIGVSVLSFFVLLLVSIFLMRSRNAGKELENMVKQRTSALAFETSKLKAMIDAIPDTMFCKDTSFKYTQCNNIFEQFMGFKEADIIGKSDTDGAWLPPEQIKRIHDIEKTVINEDRTLIFEERVNSLSSGKERVFETVKAPIRQNGAVVGLIAFVRDITQRKEMEEEIAFKTSKLQMIIDSIPDLLFCKDTNFRYTQCNRQFENFWGIQEAAMLGLTDHDGTWFSSDLIERMHNTDSLVMGEDKTFIRELELYAPLTGKEAVFESVLSPLKQNGVIVGMLAIARDVTQRRAMEEAVQAASRAKTAFLANMSHELRTPLNVVIGLTDLLLEDERLNTHITSNLIKINSAGSTLLSIVNDVLDFSKIESGKLELLPVKYYTSSLLNDVITIVITRLGEKPITFSLDIEDNMPAKLFGDDLRVKQIFTNLLTNAVKYTRQGSINLKMRCAREGDMVWMDAAVNDTGIGIREEDIPNLFLDYYQTDTRANRSIEGTGLGLPITKRLVELMDGEVNVESEYGKGSTFSLRLKQGFVSDEPIGAEIANKLRNFCYADDKLIVTKKLIRLNLSYARVLVVDDMQTNLDVASGLLRSYKMQVDCVDSGQSAIDKIREGAPAYNAVFMDHMMPGMDGIEAADKIRALGTEYARKIPIIALTANAIQGTDQMFYEHGFQAFISKPIDVIEMDSVIRRWVRDDSHEDVLVYSAPEDGESSVIEIQGVDTKKGLSLYAGETKVYLPLLRSYIANTPVILDKLRNVSEQTLPAYVISVHGLKGTSAGIGAEKLREAAFELEKMSRAGDLQGVLAKNDKLIADAEIIVADIKAWLDEYDAHSEKKPRLKAPGRELLSRLRQSCESYDIEGVDSAMAELESADYEEGAELVAWIREKIDISKMGEVAKRLAEL
jgi:PAS domain S-box-containing protein